MNKSNFVFKWVKFNNILFKHKFRLFARLGRLSVKSLFSCDIGFFVKLKNGVLAHSGLGVIISGNVTIGKNIKIYQNVTIEAFENDKIIIGNNVYIGCGSRVIGNIVIGDNVVIGANAVVSKNVPSNCTIVGIPGTIISINNKRKDFYDKR